MILQWQSEEFPTDKQIDELQFGKLCVTVWDEQERSFKELDADGNAKVIDQMNNEGTDFDLINRR